MANTPRPATGKKYRLKFLPPDATRLRCVRWKSAKKACKSTDTWAVYQHVHSNGAYTFELPAVGTKQDGVPYDQYCPNPECLADKVKVWALYVRCATCGYIGRIREGGKEVLYYEAEESEKEAT